MASSRHPSRPRVSSSSSSYFADREDRDYGYRDRDYERRDSHYNNRDKERDRLRDREGGRSGERDRERERNKDRDATAKSGRTWHDEGGTNRLASAAAKGGSLRLSGSGSPPSSEDSLNSGRTLGGQDDRGSPGAGKGTEREPGELSSGSRSEEAGEGAVAGHGWSKSARRSSLQGAEGEEGRRGESANPATKKRKYSPIVWDLDEKLPQKGFSSSLRVSSAKPHPAVASPPLPPPPPLPLPPPPPIPLHSTPKLLTPISSGPIPSPPTASGPPSLSGAQASSGTISLSPSPVGLRTSAASRSISPSPSSREHLQFSPYGDTERDRHDARMPHSSSKSSLSQDEPEPGQFPNSPGDDDADNAPSVSIAASRWAEDNASPKDGESPYVGSEKAKARHRLSSESDEGHLFSAEEGGRQGSDPSRSPESGEYIKDKSEMPAAGSTLGKDQGITIDEQYETDVNKRELIDLDEDAHRDGEEEHPEQLAAPPAAPPQRLINMLQSCRSVDEFERLNRIDEGTYGVVYRARDKKTRDIVALKKVKMEKEREGFPMTSLREINVLLSIHHPSIVDVKEVVVGSSLDSIFMVMEYMEHDMKWLLGKMKQPFSQSEVKCLMIQLLEGVKYLHDNWVLHRDLKTSNLLLNNHGELKICDFGLARQYGSPLKTYTQLVVTLTYRAPELLLGAKQYSTAIDMWSVGCIMAELLAKEPLFNGQTEVEQLDKIFKTLGTPNETIWPDFAKLPGVKCNFVRQPFNRLREKFPPPPFPPTAFAGLGGRPALSEKGFNLLNRLLLYDPKKRITAEEALNHDWFKEVPLPKMKELMPTFPAQSEHDRRMRRHMKSPDPLAEQLKRELRQAELGAGGLFG